MSSANDARIIRTKLALRDAMLHLLQQKTFESITIREICAEAGIHYATFFRHHNTKDALLEDIASDQIATLVELSIPKLDQENGEAAFLELCQYVSRHRKLWKILLTGGAAGVMRDELLRISLLVAKDRMAASSWIPIELGVRCSVALTIETLSWWLAQPSKKYSPEQISKILYRQQSGFLET